MDNSEPGAPEFISPELGFHSIRKDNGTFIYRVGGFAVVTVNIMDESGDEVPYNGMTNMIFDARCRRWKFQDCILRGIGDNGIEEHTLSSLLNTIEIYGVIYEE